MANTIIIKNSSTAAAVPAAGSLVKGELAVNVTDKKLYTKDNSGNVVLVADAALVDSAAAQVALAAAEAADSAASAALAQEWATKTSGPVAGSEYSAKYNAQLSAASAVASAGSATAADSAKLAAEAALAATLTAYDNFDDRYLGTKTSDPATDNDGNPLIGGTLYFNSTTQIMMLYTGSAWVAAYISGAAYVTLTGSETLTNKTLTAPNITGALKLNGSTGTTGQLASFNGTDVVWADAPQGFSTGKAYFFSSF